MCRGGCVISRTSFISSGYALLEVLTVIILGMTLIGHFKNFLTEVVLVPFITLIFVYMLRLIRDQRPKSLTALAALSGRRVPNLSRSLRMMEGYGLVRLKRDGHGVEPVALATSFKILID